MNRSKKTGTSSISKDSSEVVDPQFTLELEQLKSEIEQVAKKQGIVPITLTGPGGDLLLQELFRLNRWEFTTEGIHNNRIRAIKRMKEMTNHNRNEIEAIIRVKQQADFSLQIIVGTMVLAYNWIEFIALLKQKLTTFFLPEEDPYNTPVDFNAAIDAIIRSSKPKG